MIVENMQATAISRRGANDAAHARDNNGNDRKRVANTASIAATNVNQTMKRSAAVASPTTATMTFSHTSVKHFV